jgi:hypothetical protein
MVRDVLQIALTILAIFIGWKIGEKIVTPRVSAEAIARPYPVS